MRRQWATSLSVCWGLKFEWPLVLMCWQLASQMMVFHGEGHVMETSGGGAYLEEVGYSGVSWGLYPSLALLPFFFRFLAVTRREALYHHSLHLWCSPALQPPKWQSSQDSWNLPPDTVTLGIVSDGRTKLNTVWSMGLFITGPFSALSDMSSLLLTHWLLLTGLGST